MCKVGIGLPSLGLVAIAVHGGRVNFAGISVESAWPHAHRISPEDAPVPGPVRINAAAGCTCRTVAPTRVTRRPPPAAGRVLPSDHPAPATVSSGQTDLKHSDRDVSTLGHTDRLDQHGLPVAIIVPTRNALSTGIHGLRLRAPPRHYPTRSGAACPDRS